MKNKGENKEFDSEMSPSAGKVWPQVFSALSIGVSGMCTGTFHSFSAVVIPMISKPVDEGGLNIDLDQGSWIASLFFLGTILGSLSGGRLNDWLGAKRVSLAIAPIIFGLWIVAALSGSFLVLCATRIATGMCYGVFLAVVKVYNAEVSHPNIRGATSTFYSIQLSTGLLYGFTLGHFLTDWRWVTALLSIPAGLFFILCCFIPNSPYWLVEKNRIEEAQASLSWLRGGQNSDFQEEFQEMVEKKRAKDEENLNNKPGICGAFSNGRFWRPFLRIAFLMCLTEWAGMNVIAQYMVIIFRESGSAIAPTVAPIIVAGVRVGLACVSTFILRYSPRKPLFLTCCVLIFLSYMALGGFNFCKAKLQEDKSQSEEYLSLISKLGWVPLLSVMTVQAAQTIGFLSVLHFNLQAESFPTDLRSTACGLVGMVTALTRFVTTKLFPQLTEWFGYHGVFWFYGFFVAIIFFYAIKIMPENKGKSLVQTESNFAKK